jgi:SAM-dependent methyltransferase
MTDNTVRFTGKADSYDKYRPSYPKEFLDFLYGEAGFSAESKIADIGAGTGKLTELLLKRGSFVYAVEPNPDMHEKLIENFNGLGNFAAVSAPAENTTLPGSSVDFITVAQAFHWFDAVKFKAECQRILKPGGKAVLVWNSRDDESEVVKAYDELCFKLCPDFTGPSNGRRGVEEPVNCIEFFKNGEFKFNVFDNIIPLTFDNFIGAFTSASYAPNEEDEDFPPVEAALTELFDKYKKNGILKMPFYTISYLGYV